MSKICPKKKFRVYQANWGGGLMWLFDDEHSRYRPIRDGIPHDWIWRTYLDSYMIMNGNKRVHVPIKPAWLI